MSKSTTKKAIAFALKDLLSEKPLDKITINDIAEDCGSGVNGNHIDVFFSDHETARVFGVQSAMAYLTKEDAP